MAQRVFFTSESVSEGHPDKLADQISDGILDAIIAKDPKARVACETLCTTGLVVIAGEITTAQAPDYQAIARDVIRDVGYTDPKIKFDAESCGIILAVDRQSPDINQGVDRTTDEETGAGDQGMMFGYACNETPNLMPIAIDTAHRILRRLSEARRDGKAGFLRPDSKSQVTVVYENNKPVAVDTVVVSHQHTDDITQEKLREFIIEYGIKPELPKSLDLSKVRYLTNPTGRFVIGGPHGDTGLTGRKIIVDTYGGAAPHGGGAFSGKDPTKVDRSAAYMARYLAKNVVASGLAERCTVQLAYAIGVAQPVSILADTHGTSKVEGAKIAEWFKANVSCTPAGIIKRLDLLKPHYRRTAAYGHFGRDEFPWERTDLAAKIKTDLA